MELILANPDAFAAFALNVQHQSIDAPSTGDGSSQVTQPLQLPSPPQPSAGSRPMHIPSLLQPEIRRCPIQNSAFSSELWPLTPAAAYTRLTQLESDQIAEIAILLNVINSSDIPRHHTIGRLVVKFVELKGGVSAADVASLLRGPAGNDTPSWTKEQQLDEVHAQIKAWCKTTPNDPHGGNDAVHPGISSIEIMPERTRARLAIALGLPGSAAAYILPRVLERLKRVVESEIAESESLAGWVASRSALATLSSPSPPSAVHDPRKRDRDDVVSIADIGAPHLPKMSRSLVVQAPSAAMSTAVTRQAAHHVVEPMAGVFESFRPSSIQIALRTFISNGHLRLVGAPSESGDLPLLRLSSLASSPHMAGMAESFLLVAQQLFIGTTETNTETPGEWRDYQQGQGGGNHSTNYMVGTGRVPAADASFAGWTLKATSLGTTQQRPSQFLKSVLQAESGLSTLAEPSPLGPGRMAEMSTNKGYTVPWEGRHSDDALVLGTLLQQILGDKIQESPPLGTMVPGGSTWLEGMIKPVVLLAGLAHSPEAMYGTRQQDPLATTSILQIVPAIVSGFIWMAQAAPALPKNLWGNVLRVSLAVCLSVWSFASSLTMVSGQEVGGVQGTVDSPFDNRAWAQWTAHLALTGKLLFKVDLGKLQAAATNGLRWGPSHSSTQPGISGSTRPGIEGGGVGPGQCIACAAKPDTGRQAFKGHELHQCWLLAAELLHDEVDADVAVARATHWCRQQHDLDDLHRVPHNPRYASGAQLLKSLRAARGDSSRSRYPRAGPPQSDRDHPPALRSVSGYQGLAGGGKPRT